MSWQEAIDRFSCGLLLTSWIVVEGGRKRSAPAVTRRKDIGRMTVRPISSSGISGTGETPQIAKRPRRLTARPAESVRLKRKSTILMNQIFPKTSETLDLWN